MSVLLLDGPMGTLLIERGIPCPEPGWSAHALEEHPSAVRRVHEDYAAAGASVHTANTFRTREESIGRDWRRLASCAIHEARCVAGASGTVAGSIAPVADCYRPDLSPPEPEASHRAIAEHLAAAGVDMLLVETFPHVGEALSAVREATKTGLPVWVSFTAGPSSTLLTPTQVRHGAQAAVELGAAAVLVNCIPATDTLPFVRELADLGVPFGAYANAGQSEDGIGWGPQTHGHSDYADLAEQWAEAGATLIGGCCGTGPRHIAELKRRFGTTSGQTTS